MGREPVELSLILGQTYDPNGDFLWLLIIVNCTNQRRININREGLTLDDHLSNSKRWVITFLIPKKDTGVTMVGLLSLACQATTFLPPTR